jgi:hypothetical protein
MVFISQKKQKIRVIRVSISLGIFDLQKKTLSLKSFNLRTIDSFFYVSIY